MEPTPIRRLSSGGLSVPPAGVEEESPRRRLFASAAKDIKIRGGTSHHQQQNLSLASTPPALASLLTPLPGGSPQALCCVGVSPRALFGGGRSVNAVAFTSKRELLPPFSMTPAVEPDKADEADVVANVDGGRAKNKMGGLVAATHAETTAFAARWDFDITSGSPLAGGRWEWLTTARKNAEEAAAAEGKEQEEKAASDIAFRPKASSSPSRHHLPSAACCASDVTSFPMTTSPPESDRASASPAPSCGGNNEGAPAAAGWPVA